MTGTTRSDLLPGIDLRHAGDAGLATDVEDVGALVDQRRRQVEPILEALVAPASEKESGLALTTPITSVPSTSSRRSPRRRDGPGTASDPIEARMLARMSVIVRIPTTLRSLVGGASEVEVEGSTVGEVLKSLDAHSTAGSPSASSTTTATSGGSSTCSWPTTTSGSSRASTRPCPMARPSPSSLPWLEAEHAPSDGDRRSPALRARRAACGDDEDAVGSDGTTTTAEETTTTEAAEAGGTTTTTEPAESEQLALWPASGDVEDTPEAAASASWTATSPARP